MPEKRVRVVYSGSVHGVGFRFTVERIANSIGLKGWVQNCPDGSVEVVCEGGEKDLNIFLSKIKKAMAHYIRSSRIEWQEPTDEFDAFDIKFLH